MSEKKIYCIEVVTKTTRKHAMYFFVKAANLTDAALYAEQYLVPALLDMEEIHLLNRELESYELLFEAN